MAHHIGDRVRLTGTFAVGGVNTNPTAVSLWIKTPSGVETSYVPTPGATGIYTYDYDITESGKYAGEWRGTGAVQQTEPFTIEVVASAF